MRLWMYGIIFFSAAIFTIFMMWRKLDNEEREREKGEKGEQSKYQQIKKLNTDLLMWLIKKQHCCLKHADRLATMINAMDGWMYEESDSHPLICKITYTTKAGGIVFVFPWRGDAGVWYKGNISHAEQQQAIHELVSSLENLEYAGGA